MGIILLACRLRSSPSLHADAQLQQQAYAVTSAAAGEPVRDPAVSHA
jgi:hypothetical protein